jgi:uncharacterized protein YeaO (DUF488 family)
MTVRESKRAKPKPRATRARSKPPAIGIKRVYEQASAGDGVRILIDRLWPRGVSKASLKYDVWARELAPSNDLRKWYGHVAQRWVEFRRRYVSELAAHRDELAALRSKIKGRAATLLTATREIELSHAIVLRDLLKAKRSR